MLALHTPGRKLSATFASLALVGGLALTTRMSAPTTPTVPDISKMADVCTADRLCDGQQMRVAMMEQGQVSLNSPVGKALREIGSQGDVSDANVLEFMGALEQNLRYTKDIATLVEAEGMFAIRPAQYLADPSKPYSSQNAFMKADFDMVVVLTKGGKYPGDCPSFTVRPDGTFTPITGPAALLKRTGSHGISTGDCTDVRNDYMRKMGPMPAV